MSDDQDSRDTSGQDLTEDPVVAPEAGGSVPPPLAPPPPPAGPAPRARLAPQWQAPAATSYAPPPARRGGLSALWVVLVILLVGVVTIGVSGYLLSSSDGLEAGSLMSERVGVITIEGVIADGGRGGLFFGPSGARAIMEDLRAAAKDDGLKAVVILINSPGGSPAASHAIYQEILKLRQRKKVVACMTDVAASGGYYVAAACDKIVAQGSTLTGSIGVIFGGMSYYGLMQKLGVTNATQTAGKFKDAGSPLRPMRPDEKALLQGLLDDIYRQFIEAVATGRDMKIERVRALAEGRIYTGSQAKAAGLVDELGNFYDAVRLAGKLAGIKGEPKVKHLGESDSLFGSLMSSGESFNGLLGRRSAALPAALPLQGPMLILPYVYEMVPVVSAAY